jgi:hypothetical protein
MVPRERVESLFRVLAIVGVFLCFAGAIVGMAVVIVRIPALAGTRLEVLFGTLQGVAVSLLFAIAALQINLTIMVRRATRPLTAASPPGQTPV